MGRQEPGGVAGAAIATKATMDTTVAVFDPVMETPVRKARAFGQAVSA